MQMPRKLRRSQRFDYYFWLLIAVLLALPLVTQLA